MFETDYYLFVIFYLLLDDLCKKDCLQLLEYCIFCIFKQLEQMKLSAWC